MFRFFPSFGGLLAMLGFVLVVGGALGQGCIYLYRHIDVAVRWVP